MLTSLVPKDIHVTMFDNTEISVELRPNFDMYVNHCIELRAIKRQFTKIHDNMLDLKSTPMVRKKWKFKSNPDSAILYNMIWKQDWPNLSNSKAPCMKLYYELQDAFDSDINLHVAEYNSKRIDVIRHSVEFLDEKNTEGVVPLDNDPTLTIGDLSLIIALINRYIEWCKKTLQIIYESKLIKQGLKKKIPNIISNAAIKQLEKMKNQAVKQLCELLETDDL